MTKLSKSPKRFSFQKESYLKRRAEEGKTPENDPDVKAMEEYYDNFSSMTEQKEADPSWKENNMEYDLRSTPWILEKVRTDEAYAQNLYAAMCNNDFQKKAEYTPDGVIKTLSDQLPKWSCSWRYAGGIVADMREEGDYIDWYCSGIRDVGLYDSKDGEPKELTEEQLQRKAIYDRFVGESAVTDEIREDLLKLGWEVIQEE